MKETRPLVSIVIPCYNQKESFLKECILSAQSQTYENIEIVISDNHSTNNTSEILKEFSNGDNRVRIVRPDKFLNMSESFLFVFTQARGSYICYLSSDDILLPDCISVLLPGLAEDDNNIFAHGQAKYFWKDGTEDLRWDYFNGQTGSYKLDSDLCKLLLNFNYICFGGCLLKKDAWEALVRDLREKGLVIKHFLDLLITIFLFERGNVYYSHLPLAKVRMENEQRNRSQAVLIDNALSIWNYISRDSEFKEICTGYNIDIEVYRKKQFAIFSKALVHEYLNGFFNIKQFKEYQGYLNLFKIQGTFRDKILIKGIRLFPNLSLRLFRLIR